MKPQKNYNSLQHIRLMCTDKMSIDTKIFMSFLTRKRIPESLEVLILVIEYCQFFSQALLFNEYFAHTPSSRFNTLFHNTIPIARIFSPGDSFEFSNDSNLAIVALALVIGYLIVKYVFIVSIIFIVAKKIQGPPMLMLIWKWFFKVHGRLLFYSVTSFWVGMTLAANQDKFDPFEIGSLSMIVIAITAIIVEYLFSLCIYMRYAYILPHKSFLATKNNRQEIINLTQKFVMQILVISLAPDSMTSSLIFTIINLLLSLYSLYNFFTILPSYKLKALAYEGSFLVAFACFNMIFLFRSIITLAIEEKLLMDTVILLILVLIPLLIKATLAYLNKISLNLINENKNERPELLIHKINIIKYFRKKQKPFTDYSKNIGYEYLVHTSYNQCSKDVFGVDSESLEHQTLDVNSKASANKIFLTYLENLSLKFPKNDLIKLYLAYYYGRKFKDYGVAIKILFGLQQFSSTKMALNASVLIYEIQKKLRTEYENSKGIDLATYIYNIATIAQVKLKILEQAELQIKICQEFNENSPDLAKIFNHAQKVGHKRNNLEKKMKEVFDTLPEYSIEPQLLSARYQLVLNHSILDYLEHAKAFTKKCQMYAKHLAGTDLCQENIYQKENGFLMVQGGNNGTITYCSHSAENIFGQNLTGNHASVIAPSFLQNFFFDLFRNPFEAKNTDFFGNIVRTFGFHRLGYLIEMDLYINIHPFISQGLYYNIITHPIQSSKEYLMVSENGIIEAYTQGIGNELGLFSIKDSTLKKNILISEISRELARISHAYNMVNLKRKRRDSYKKLINFGKDLEEIEQDVSEDVEISREKFGVREAEALCEVFNSEGRPLALNPLHYMHNKPLTYNCKIHTQFYGSYFVKFVTLEKIEADRADIEVVKSFVWMPSEEVSRAIKPGLTQITTFEQRKSDTFQLGKTITGPTFLKPEGDNLESLLGSYPLNSEKESCELTEHQIDHMNYAHILQKSKTQGSEEVISPSASARRYPLIKETKLEDQAVKVSSSKADNNTPSQLKKMKDAFGTRWEEEEKNAVEKLEIAQKSLGSQKSKSSAQGRVSKALKEAMTINYYPKYYNVFISVFYCLLLAVFLCQLGLKLTFDGDIGSRKEEKDVIRSSETRNDLLTTIQRDLRYMQDISIGRLQEEDLGLIRKSIPQYIASVGNSLVYLGALNNKLLLASKGLAEEFRQRLFERNVRVYETDFNEKEQKFIYLNNFQATERIVESGAKGLALAETDMNAATPYFNFIFRNALNDFLVKCDEISDIFIKALDSQEENTLQSLQWILTATNVIILFIIIISGVVVARQCDTEKKYMLAFIKLNHIKVKEILDGLLRFKRVLEEDSNFDEVSNMEISKFARTTQKTEMMKSKKTQQMRLQNYNLRGTFRKYLQYWLNLVFIMLIVGGFVAVNYVIARDTITNLHVGLHQIQFSDRISARLNLAVAATQEMLSRENTFIRNELAPIQVDICLEDVKIMRKELSYVFDTEGQAAYDSIVETIVFQDACPYLDGVPQQACEVTKQGTEHAGLLNAASQLETGIITRRDGYQNSNKSSEALKQIQIDTLDTAVYPNLVLNYGTTVISETIEKVYEKEIDDAQAENNLIYAATCVMMVLVAVLAWYGLLTKVREADGKFKKVLQTLPPNLILSNFVLKSYLLETSQGTLDFVRNDI